MNTESEGRQIKGKLFLKYEQVISGEASENIPKKRLLTAGSVSA